MPKGTLDNHESLQEDLYRMQRTIWRRNKEVIDHSILIKEPNFAKYEANYQRKVSKFESISSDSEMLKAIFASDIIYVGDYHTCNQSQRSFLRILKATVKKTRNFVIGLELIHTSYQKILDKYMAGRMSDETFLEKIGFEQHWIFDLWPNFKPLFDFAKYHNIPIYALDAAPLDSSLKERDEATGRLVASRFARDPRKKIFVFIGDLHLAPQHLPAEVERVWKKLWSSTSSDRTGSGAGLLRAGGPRNDMPLPPRSPSLKGEECPRSLTLYQNSETIYWKLAKKGIEDQVSVVKINGRSFCRMHTPPMIVQQSYINWLEHEEGEIDYSDAKHSFMELVDRIAKFLSIKLGKEKDDVEVYTSGDLTFLNKLKRRKSFSKEALSIVKRQILASESYYIAAEKIVYLANLSLNHASEEAAHFIKSLCSGPEFPRDLVDAFYANILHESLGFFGSKLVNSKRKCLHEKGFKDLLAYFQTVKVPTERQLEYETAHLVTEYLKFEKKGKPLRYTTIFEQGAELFMAITHAIGYMLGDKMYYALKTGKIKKPFIRELFFDLWEEEGAPFEVYNTLRNKLKSVKIPKRM